MGEISPPLYMDVGSVYSGDELGLPFRDLISEGVVTAAAVKVSQRAAGGASMSVDIAPGAIWILGDDGGAAGLSNQPCYRGRNDSIVNLAVSAAHATNPRIDRVVAECIDQAFAGAGRLWRLRVIAGTPTSGANLTNLSGEAAQPNTAVTLAHVLVPAASSSVTDPNISDVRPRARVAQGEALGGMDVGEGKLWFTNTPPPLWKICDGSLISRTTYAALFAVLGTTYGAGDGATTFALPDLRGKTPVGRDAAQTEYDSLNETSGAKTKTLTIGEMPNHAHGGGSHTHGGVTGGQSNDHTHNTDYVAIQATDGGFQSGNNMAVSGAGETQVSSGVSAGHTHTIPSSGATVTAEGGGAAFSILDPYRVVNFIIYAGVA